MGIVVIRQLSKLLKSRLKQPFLNSLVRNVLRNGGAMRDRTADLLRARQALSQLSYSPKT